MVPCAINNKFDSWQLKELNFYGPKDSESYDAPLLPLVKLIVNCTRSHAIAIRNPDCNPLKSIALN